MSVVVLAPSDTQAPRIISLSPADGASGVAVDAALKLIFDEPIKAGVSSIVLRSGSATGPEVERFNPSSSSRVSIAGDQLTLRPSQPLAAGTAYVLVLSPGSVTDESGNPHAGALTYDVQTAVPLDTSAPSIIAFDPAKGATGVAIDAVLRITFDEPIKKGRGVLELRAGLATGTLIESFDVTTSARLTMAGATVVVDPTSNLVANTSYFLLVPAGAISDLAGNPSTGVVTPNTYSFRTSADSTLPTLTSRSPLASANSVPFDSNITLAFSETILPGSGFIELRIGSAAGELFESFDVSKLAISGSGVTIDPTREFGLATKYALVIPRGALKDQAGNPFVGVNTAGTANTYEFTTSNDISAPQTIGSSPADGAASVAVNTPLTLSFNEAVRRGIGTIELRTAAGLVVEAFEAATSPRVSFSGFSVTIDPTSDLAFQQAYSLLIPAGAIRDSSGNPYAGTAASGDGAYDFTTVSDITAPTLSNRSPADGSSSVSVSSSMVLTFSEPIRLGTGEIILRAGSATGAYIEGFDGASGERLSITGSTLTLKPSVDLQGQTVYFLVIPDGAITDLAGNRYPGTNTYDFATADTTPPKIEARAPADDSVSVATDSNIILTFSEPVLRGEGSLELRAGSATGPLFESFNAATSSRITIAGTKVTVDPVTNSLSSGTKYVLVMPGGAFKDAAGNGVVADRSYEFMTAAASAAVDPLYLDYRRDPLTQAMVLSPWNPRGVRAGTTASYVWQQSNNGGATWTTITGQTDATLDTVGLAAVEWVRVQVTYGGTTSGTLLSAASTPDHRSLEGAAMFTLSSKIEEDAALSILPVSGAPPVSELETLWYRLPIDGSSPIPVATSPASTGSPYTPGDADVGMVLRAAVRYSPGAKLSRTVFLDTPGPVTGLDDPCLSTLAISGELRQGSTLTLGGAIRDDDLLSVLEAGDSRLQILWQAYSIPESSAGPAQPIFEPLQTGGVSMVLGEEHVGRSIAATVTYLDPGKGLVDQGVPVFRSGSVANINDAPLGQIEIFGTPTQGGILDAAGWSVTDADNQNLDNWAGDIDPAAWQWAWYAVDPLVPALAMKFGEGQRVLLGQEQVGRLIRLQGTYLDARGQLNSLSTMLVDSDGQVLLVSDEQDAPHGELKIFLQDPLTGLEISGDWEEGQTLILADEVTDPDGIPQSGSGSKQYQWLRDGAPLAGETRTSLKITQELLGGVDPQKPGWGTSEISARLSYEDPLAPPDLPTELRMIEVLSINSGVLKNRNDLPTGTIGLSIERHGEPVELPPTEGDLLRLNLAALKDPDGFDPQIDLVQWRWLSEGADGVGAAAGWFDDAELLLTQEMVDKALTIEARYTDGFGEVETVRCLLPRIENRPDPGTGPVLIQGVASRGPAKGDTLTAAHELVDPDGPDSLPVEWIWRARGSDREWKVGDGPTITLTQAEVGASLQLEAHYVDRFETRELHSSDWSDPVLPEISGRVYHWRSHTLMAGVSIDCIPVEGSRGEPIGALAPASTLADGLFRFVGPEPEVVYQLQASRPIADGERTSAVTIADAMAALKLALGRNPNPDPDGTGPLQPDAVSPYQWIAADLDGDGCVDRADAQAILRVALGGSDDNIGWRFVAEGEDLWLENQTSDGRFVSLTEALSRSDPPTFHLTVDGHIDWFGREESAVQSDVFEQANLIAVLRGDVDGSWIEARPAEPWDVQILPRAYFDTLLLAHPSTLHPAQFGLI